MPTLKEAPVDTRTSNAKIVDAVYHYFQSMSKYLHISLVSVTTYGGQMRFLCYVPPEVRTLHFRYEYASPPEAYNRKEFLLPNLHRYFEIRFEDQGRGYWHVRPAVHALTYVKMKDMQELPDVFTGCWTPNHSIMTYCEGTKRTYVNPGEIDQPDKIEMAFEKVLNEFYTAVHNQHWSDFSVATRAMAALLAFLDLDDGSDYYKEKILPAVTIAKSGKLVSKSVLKIQDIPFIYYALERDPEFWSKVDWNKLPIQPMTNPSAYSNGWRLEGIKYLEYNLPRLKHRLNLERNPVT